MNSTFDIHRNCVKIKADIRGRGLQFRGSGVLYPLESSEKYDYVLTAQHILKEQNGKKLKNCIDKISSIEIDVYDNDQFISYKTISKQNIAKSLFRIGEEFLIIKIDKGDKQFTPFYLAEDLIEDKPLQLLGISRDAQDLITKLECKCVDKGTEVINVTSQVDDMDSLHGMSGGGIFALNQPLLYGVLWKYAATDGEFHNVRITQALEDKINKQLAANRLIPLKFINIAQCKQEMKSVYDDIFFDINDSILVNRNIRQFPLEDRFVMPDFIETVQCRNTTDISNVSPKKPTMGYYRNIYLGSNDLHEFSEQYLDDYYGQLNETSNREVRIPASSLLNPDRKILLIIGGPGNGKSSLLKYITIQLLKGKIAAYDGYLPVWMPFSYMARNSDYNIKDIIQLWLQEQKLWNKYKCFWEFAFEQHKILLIADGIDEWGDDPLLADSIISQVKKESNTGNLIAIFSSREYGIENINTPFSPEDTYTIAPLSAIQQDSLVKKCVDYYNGMIHNTQRTAEFLSAKLRSLQDVSRMKENPMLLTILIGQYLQGNELPHNNIAAMDCVVEQLFVKHLKSRKFQAHDFSRTFDYTNNKMLLGVLSKEMFDFHNDGSMDKTQAEILLNQYLNSQTKGQELNNAHIVDDLFNHDTHQLGVLEKRNGSRISFINRQLQEFMSAKYMAVDESRAEEFIIGHAPETGLHQVILFLFEMMPASVFVKLYNVLKSIETNDYRNYYLYKLKLEVLVRSIKAPKGFLLEEIKSFIQTIEWESDYDIKHDLLEIFLDGLYNASLKDFIEEFISKYVPSASVYRDVRLSGLAQVEYLTAEERRFVVGTIINGDINNKKLASEVIRKHISNDVNLLEMVNSYIKSSTAPLVLAFFIRSVASEGIDVLKEDELVNKIESRDIYTRFYKIVYSLFRGENVAVGDFLKLIPNIPYSIKEEVTLLLQKYYSKEDKVRIEALYAIGGHYRQSEVLSNDIAWKYLLSCWLNHPDVINAITEELKQKYPFNIGNSYDLWDIIQKQEISPELYQVITEWALSLGEDFIWRVESTIVNSIVKEPRIKNKLLESLEEIDSYQHIAVYPLIKNWGEDKVVIERLQRYLDEEPLNKSSWIAGFAYEIFQGDDDRIKDYLDRCIEDKNIDLQKDRAVYAYINHYKEEFAEKYIQRIINGEISMNDRILGSKWGILDAILANYSDRQDVQNYLIKNYSDDYRFAGHFIVKYHGKELASKMIMKWFHMDARLRLMMIHKLSNLSSIDERIEGILRLFRQEGDGYILCDTVLSLVDHLRRQGKDEDAFKIADEVFNTSQITTEYIYKMRFCIYLMYHKIDDYVQLNLVTGGKENEFTQFHIFHNDSPFIEKTIADEALYLLNDGMANLNKLVKEDDKIYSYMVFFSKYVNPFSDVANIIVRYIRENVDKIKDANFLLFLKKVGNQKQLLKRIVMDHIDNGNNEMIETVAQIIASDFDKDSDILQLIKMEDWKWGDSLNRVSLNCSLNTNNDKVKEIYAQARNNQYYLDNSFASYNFVITQEDVDDIIKRLRMYVTGAWGSYLYRLVVSPLTTRIKRDTVLADKIYFELIETDDPRIKVGFYSTLISAGVKYVELMDWREQQHESLQEYGRDIVMNRDRQLIVTLQ